MIRFAPLLVLLLTASVASAQHCYTQQTYATPAYAAPTYVQPVTYQAAIALFVPSYYLGQNPVPTASSLAGPAAPVQSDCAKTHELLVKHLDRQEKRDEAMFEWMKRTSPQPIPQPLPVGPPIAPQPQYQSAAPPPTAEQVSRLKTDGIAAGLATCNARCAACHEAKLAGTKGGGFTLLVDGQFAALGYKQRFDVFKAIRAGTMPKNGALTDYEHDAIVVAITSLPAPTN